MMYTRAASTRISLFRSRMYFVKYAIIQCAKGPFASDSISMNVVLSSNTAYRDQFSGRTRFSSLPEKREEKKKRRRYPIPVLSVRRTQPQIRFPIRGEYVVFENVFLLLLATIFPASRRTSPIMRLLDVYPSLRTDYSSLADVLHAIIRREARSIP